jgi:hypothetical protein
MVGDIHGRVQNMGPSNSVGINGIGIVVFLIIAAVIIEKKSVIHL